MTEKKKEEVTPKPEVKTEVAAKPTPKESAEQQAFFGNDFTLDNGDTIAIKKPGLKKQIQIIKKVGQTLKDLKEVKDINIDAFTWKDVVTVLPDILTEVPDAIVEIGGLILDKDEKWVEENVVLEDLIEILVPFFKTYGELIKAKFNIAVKPASQK